MVKPRHHHKKKSARLLTKRRFSAAVAVVLVALSASLGYLWFRSSDAAGDSVYFQIYIYDATNNNAPLANFPIKITNAAGLNCDYNTPKTDGNGFFTVRCPNPGFLGIDPSAAYYEFQPYSSGYYVSGPNNRVFVYTSAPTATYGFYIGKTDTDRDGVYDVNDRCPTQVGPASNGGCPVPAPAPAAAAPAPIPKPAAPKSTSTPKPVATTSKPAASSPAPATSSAPAPTDTTPPSSPTDLKLATPSSGSVTLTWAAATDDTGVTRYSVERSEDNTAWDMLNDNVTATTYTDTTAAYAKKYHYRVIAYDAATNASASVDAEITTTQFEANTQSDQETTISSDDAVVSVVIPSGALEEAADCRVIKDEDIEVSLPKGTEAKAGPYRLVCKLANGDAVDSFKQPVRYTVSVDKGAMGGLKPVLYGYQDNQWSKRDTAFNTKDNSFSFEADSSQTILVAGVKDSNLLPLIATGGVVLLLLIGGGIWFWRRRAASNQYDDTSGYMTGLSTPAPNPATPVTPTPVTPPSSPVDQQPPGQHSIQVPSSAGELKAPFAEPPEATPAAPEYHHSPLDRLNDTSSQPGTNPTNNPPQP